MFLLNLPWGLNFALPAWNLAGPPRWLIFRTPFIRLNNPSDSHQQPPPPFLELGGAGFVLPT